MSDWDNNTFLNKLTIVDQWKEEAKFFPDMIQDLAEGIYSAPEYSDPNIDQKINLIIQNLTFIEFIHKNGIIHFHGEYGNFVDQSGSALHFRADLSITEYQRFWRYFNLYLHQNPEEKISYIDIDDSSGELQKIITQELKNEPISYQIVKCLSYISMNAQFDDPEQESEWVVKIIHDHLEELSTEYNDYFNQSIVTRIAKSERHKILDMVIELLEFTIKNQADFCNHNIFSYFLDLLPESLIEAHDKDYRLHIDCYFWNCCHHRSFCENI